MGAYGKHNKLYNLVHCIVVTNYVGGSLTLDAEPLPVAMFCIILYHSKRAKFMLMMMGWSDTFCGMKS
jgi:hypothetical protein